MNRQGKNWIIDAALGIGFLFLMIIESTGLVLHQWLGLAIGGLAVYHALVHRKWLEVVTTRFFGKTSNQARARLAVDAAVLVGFVVMTVTGLGISTLLNISHSIADYQVWRDLHVYASLGTLAFLVLKIGMHWRWIVTMAPRLVFGPEASAPVRQPAPRPVAATYGRRDFARLMGTAGAVSLFVGARVLLKDSGLPAATASAETIEAANVVAPTATVATVASNVSVSGKAVAAAGATATATPKATSAATSAVGTTAATGSTAATAAKATTTATATAATATTAKACSYRCPKGLHCPYPGRCRQYTDANKNGLCDLGECL